MLVNLQHVHGNGVGLRARRPPFDVKGELLWKLHFEHIESMFSEAFWARLETEDVKAIWPEVMEWRRWQVCRGWRVIHSPMLKSEDNKDEEKRRRGSWRYVLPKKFQ